MTRLDGAAGDGTAGDLAADIVALSRERSHWGDPADGDAMLALVRSLHAVGRRDLPLGRLFEGHVDALQIVSRYGAPATTAAAWRAAEDGGVFGVWNADLPGEPLRLVDGRLSGGKSFASGAGLIGHALVTADSEEGRRLLLLDLAKVPPLIDRGWWKTTGMQRSETHLVRWSDAPIAPDDIVGPPGCYATEPWFSGGALRFVAVQAGGIAALFDHARDHLVATARDADPHQAARLARLYTLADMAAAMVRRSAERWFEGEEEARLARVAAARIAVLDAAEEAIAVAQQAVGVQGSFTAHPLASVVADLSVYLRQPAPDAQRRRVAAAAVDGLLDPCP